MKNDNLNRLLTELKTHTQDIRSGIYNFKFNLALLNRSMNNLQADIARSKNKLHAFDTHTGQTPTVYTGFLKKTGS